MRLRPTKSTIALLGGGLCLTILVIGVLAWLVNGQLAQRTDELAKREAELLDGQKIAKRREMAQAELEKDRQQILFLENSVSDAAYVPTMLKQVEDLAVNTKNKVLAVRPQIMAEAPTKLQQRRDPNAQDKEKQASDSGSADKKDEKKPEPYTRLGINLTTVGSFRSTQLFIEKLNHFPKIVSVDEIQLHPHHGKESEPQDLLDVELKLTAFVMKQQTPPGPAGAALANADVKGVTQ